MSLATIRQAIRDSTMSQADKDAALNGIRRAQKSRSKKVHFQHNPDMQVGLRSLFNWDNTPEGHLFWSGITLKMEVTNELEGIDKTLPSKPKGFLDLLRY